jgi:hypothetical protein
MHQSQTGKLRDVAYYGENRRRQATEVKFLTKSPLSKLRVPLQRHLPISWALYRDKKLLHKTILFQRLLLPVCLTLFHVPVTRPVSV